MHHIECGQREHAAGKEGLRRTRHAYTTMLRGRDIVFLHYYKNAAISGGKGCLLHDSTVHAARLSALCQPGGFRHIVPFRLREDSFTTKSRLQSFIQIAICHSNGKLSFIYWNRHRGVHTQARRHEAQPIPGRDS